MECFKQVKVDFYSEDFPFHVSRQGGVDKVISSPFHWHEFIEILYCDEGKVLVTIDNAEYTMKPGDMILLGPNVVHKTYKTKCDPGSIYNVLFAASAVQSVGTTPLENRCMNAFFNFISSFNYHYIESEKVPPGIGDVMVKLKYRFDAKEDFNCIFIRSHLLELIGQLCEHGFFAVQANNLNRQTIDAISETVSYMQAHCGEKITLSDMAERANLSYHYYSKLFKQVTGKNFAAYLASARVFAAERYMIEGKYSLQEIAGKVGLYPQSNFNHTYKRLRGFSPNEFIKKL